MGCFDVVCGLTNVPIHSGEKCHLIVLKKDCSWDTIVWLGSSMEGRFSVDTVYHGEYNDYGSVENTQPLTKKQKDLLETFFNHMSDNQRKSFFICDTAWQWCQEKWKDYTPHWITERRERRVEFAKAHIELPNYIDPGEAYEGEEIALARVLLAFSHACKHPLSGLGQYHQYDGDQIADIREHLELVQKRLKEVENRYKSYGEE